MNNKQNVQEYNVSTAIAKPMLAAVCSWCGEQILVGQPTSKSYDGEVMHFGCASEADDADIGDCSC